MKEKIINFLKVFILLFAMTMGFYLVYCGILWSFGLPLVDWLMGLALGLAVLTEYGYYRWINEG